MILLDFRTNEEGRKRKKFKIWPGLYHNLSERTEPLKKFIEALEIIPDGVISPDGAGLHHTFEYYTIY